MMISTTCSEPGKTTRAGKPAPTRLAWNPWTGALADLLIEQTKVHGGLSWKAGSFSDEGAQIFFTNSGTEANEGASKFGRKIGKEMWSQLVNGDPWDDQPRARNTVSCVSRTRLTGGRLAWCPRRRTRSTSSLSSPLSRVSMWVSIITKKG